ncbi:MAG: ATP-dependent sacrificial sulfur transferase LarE [Desulfobacter sp.]|nr:MAG: ATP-dependent sacrificial sulfur transferase LarE [Desulfobacter sp.]
MPVELTGKFENLKKEIKQYDCMALAFSGGADSVFLLAAARAAGLERILAVTVVSAFFTQKEVARAKRIAKGLGVEHLCLEMDVFDNPDVVRNGARRCYHCKGGSFSMIKKAAAGRGIHTLAHGINVDDLGDYRPGIEAAESLEFKAPLVSSGFSKAEIRACSKAMGLESWNLPSQSCLATRIPLGEKITLKGLKMVEEAEEMLRDMGLGQVRVRCHRDLARIELLPGDFPRMLEDGVRERISRELTGIGFAFVALDLGGYETGKMNPAAQRKEMKGK